MPISYRIDHARRLVAAEGHGALTDQDVFDYQSAVWSRADVAGYDEVMDMSDVTRIVAPSIERVQQLASIAAQLHSSSSESKFAIIAPSDLAFGLARMYQTFRAVADGGKRKVGVFRTAKEATEFLGIEGPGTD